MRLVLLVAGVFVLCCASLVWLDLRAGPVVSVPAPRSWARDHRPPELDEAARGSERAEIRAVAPAVPAEALDDDELIAELRRAARAWFDQDLRALERGVEDLLSDARTPRRVLAWMRGARLPRASLEERGAGLVLGFAAASEPRRGQLTLDGGAFTLEFLRTLVELPLERAEPIASFAATLETDDRPAIGARWLATIVGLRERFPEHAANLEPLLAALLEPTRTLAEADADAGELAGWLATSSDAWTIRATLAVLLHLDADGVLPLALDLHARLPRGSAAAVALVDALARHAPVERAAAVLARLADATQYGAFARLGARPGGLEAVQREYNALVASASNPLARRMLVAGMGGESQRVLLGIAESDPDATVRRQALFTATLQPTDGPEVMTTVRAHHAVGSDPAGGLSTPSALAVAENVTLHGSPAARAEAVRWMREVAADPRERPEDRRLAYDKLLRRARAEERLGLEPPP